MKKNIFAVCDLEVDYAFNFMDYLNQKKNLPFEIQAFTTAESLIAYGKENHIELLLISDKAMRKEVRDLGIGKIIILSEGVHPPELDQYSSVYKYQSSSDVIREVMACYGEEKSLDPVTFPVLKKTMEIIGERAVLYLNLESYSGFEELLGKKFPANLSDLFYYVRQGNENLIHRMNGMIQTVNNLDFIPPVRTPSDIRTVDWEDWERLLQEIVLHSSYEVLILDMGENGDEDFRLLEMCRKIYMPVLNDTLSVCKVTQFENLLRIWNKEKILEKTEKVHLPFHMDRISSDAYVEQLVWSELGDYIRELLRKERS